MAAPQHEQPRGMDKYDYFALSEEQQERLNQHKVSTRVANEHYLRKHPELDCLLKTIINRVLRDRPENIHEYCADFFSQQTEQQLALMLSDQVTRVKGQHNHTQQLISAAQTLPPEELVYDNEH